MSIVCLSNLFFANKILKHILFNGRCQNTLSLLLRRRHSPTSLSTSNHLHQWVLRGEVLRRIFRVTLADSHNDRVFCPLFIARYTLRNIFSINSRDNMCSLVQRHTNASENHLLENTPRNTHWCEWLVFLRGS